MEPEDSEKNLSLADRTSAPVAPMTNPESTHHESPGTESALHQRVAMISNGTYEVVATDVDGASSEEMEAVAKDIGDLINGIQAVSNELSFREGDYNINKREYYGSRHSKRVKEMLEILEETLDKTRDVFHTGEHFRLFVEDERKRYPNVPEDGFKLNASVQFCARELQGLLGELQKERADFDLQHAIDLTQVAVNLASKLSDKYNNEK